MQNRIKNRKCAECGADYPPVQPNQKYCCTTCAKKHKYEPKNYTCIICNRPFTKKWKKNTCSEECERLLRSEKSKAHQPKGMKLSPEIRQKCIDRGISDQTRLAQMASPKVGAFDTNIHAKAWVLKSPDGTIYNITNLQNFFRQHPELIDTSYKIATKRIANLKYNTLKGINNTSWHGWHLIAWSYDFVNRD